MNNSTLTGEPLKDQDLTIHILLTEIEMVGRSKWFTPKEKDIKINEMTKLIENHKKSHNVKH